MIPRLWQRHHRLVLGALGGAVVGYLLYRFVGCRTGTCPLTADPVTAMGVYALLGALIFRHP